LQKKSFKINLKQYQQQLEFRQIHLYNFQLTSLNKKGKKLFLQIQPNLLSLFIKFLCVTSGINYEHAIRFQLYNK
jgi:hypothetical protein